MDAVGHLGRHADHPRVDGGHVDGGIGYVDGPRGPLGRQQVERPPLSVEGQGLVSPKGGEDCLHGSDVLPEPGAWRVEVGPVATGDVRPDLRPQPQPEAPLGGLGQLPGRFGGDHGAARERQGNAGCKLEVAHQCRRRARQVRRAASFGDNQAVEPDLGGIPGQRLDLLERGGRHHHVELHGVSSFMARVTSLIVV